MIKASHKIFLILLGVVSFFCMPISALANSTNEYYPDGYLQLRDILGWQIQIDDSVYQVEENQTIALHPGEHQLKTAPINTKNWYFTAHTQFFTIEESDTLLLSLNDLKIKTGQNGSFPKIHVPQTSVDFYPKSNISFVQDIFKPTLLVTAVAANWASFYIKRQADGFYREYQETSSSGRMKYYYDKSAEYDYYANVLLAVSVGSLSTYLFILLVE